jgi:hypothetical protein
MPNVVKTEGPDTRAGAMLHPDAVPDEPTDLLPGEAEHDTRDDEYYGRVEVGVPSVPHKAVLPDVNPDVVQGDIEDGTLWLDGDKQNHFEVLTGKRVQALTVTPEERDKRRAERLTKEREQKERAEKERATRAKAQEEARAKRRGEKPGAAKPGAETKPVAEAKEAKPSVG